MERSDQTLTYRATDANMQMTTRTITVIVDDSVGPAITFSPTTLYLEAGDDVAKANYTREATVLDRVDGMLDSSLLVVDTSGVDVNVRGTYTAVYTLSVSDSSGNAASATPRTVVVRDTLPPVLTVAFTQDVLEGNLILHEAATMFVFPAVNAFDTFDGSVTASSVALDEQPVSKQRLHCIADRQTHTHTHAHTHTHTHTRTHARTHARTHSHSSPSPSLCPRLQPITHTRARIRRVLRCTQTMGRSLC